MAMRRLLVTGMLALCFVSSPAFAGDGDESEVKRDPKGVKGISPYREELAKGRSAFAAGDGEGAIEAFDAAIAKDGKRMMAYLLKAQAQLSAGDLSGALKTTKKAKKKRGNEGQTAKLLFFAADLEERNAAPPSTQEKKSKLSEALLSTWEKVKEGWTTYSAYLSSHSRVPDYKATASERKKQVDARVQREKAYGAVAERIKKNAAERAKKKK